MPGISEERLKNLLAHCKDSAASVTELIAGHLGAEDLAIEVGDPQAGLGGLQGTEAETTALAVVRDIGDLFTLFYLDPGPMAPGWWGDSMSGQEQLAGITTALAKLISPEEPTEAPDLMWEKSLGDAADLHDFPEDVNVIPFELKSGDREGRAFLIAVETEPSEPPDSEVAGEPGETSAGQSTDEVAGAASDGESKDETTPESAEKTAPRGSQPEEAAANSVGDSLGNTTEVGAGPYSVKSFDQLPLYARTLLHVKVPVIVTLATKRESVNEILSLSPGSILQFKKSCEEPLDLSVGSRPIARGEAVKVGEKFGLRIMSMLLPSDRHITLKAKSEQVSV